MFPRKNVIFIIILVLGLLAAHPAMAQYSDQAEMEKITTSDGLGLRPSSTPFSLLDLSRIKWSHSYSVAYFSGGGTSSSLGVMNSQMFYEFSRKLSLTLNLGVAHNPSSFWGNGDTDAIFLPGFHLDYHPSDKFHMSITYQRGLGLGNPYYQPGFFGW